MTNFLTMLQQAIAGEHSIPHIAIEITSYLWLNFTK